MSKSSNCLDVYFHMANHYRKLNNAKSRVNSGCRSKTKLDGTEMKKTKKGNSTMDSPGKMTHRSGRPKTRRNVSDMPRQMKSKSRGPSNKSRVSKDRSSSTTRKSRTRSSRSGSQSSRTSNSSNHAAGDTRSRNTSGERSTTHGVESIVKDSVNEHEYLQFALRITEDIIKNDLYSCVEMKRVFNSHIEANRGRLELNKMRDQVRNLAKELNVKFDESEIYTLGPTNGSKNFTICTNRSDDKRCELIYVANNLTDCVPEETLKTSTAGCQCSSLESTTIKKPSPEIQSPKDEEVQIAVVNETCCKSMNTIQEDNSCDACTNTKVPNLKNTLIHPDPIIPKPKECKDCEVQAVTNVLVIETKSQACCKSLEKIWVLDVSTSTSCPATREALKKNVEPSKHAYNTVDSDSSIHSAELLKLSLEKEAPARVEIGALITKNIIPAIQTRTCHCNLTTMMLPAQANEVEIKYQPDEPEEEEKNEDAVTKEIPQPKILPTEVKKVQYDKPFEITQPYLYPSSHLHTSFAPASSPVEPRKNCFCPCCKKKDHPRDTTTIWDDVDVNDFYNNSGVPLEKEKEKKNDEITEETLETPKEEQPMPIAEVTFREESLPIVEKPKEVIKDNLPEREKTQTKKKCICGKKSCQSTCVDAEYSNLLPEMLARFFPSTATQTTPSDLMLIARKSDESPQAPQIISSLSDEVDRDHIAALHNLDDEENEIDTNEDGVVGNGNGNERKEDDNLEEDIVSLIEQDILLNVLSPNSVSGIISPPGSLNTVRTSSPLSSTPVFERREDLDTAFHRSISKNDQTIATLSEENNLDSESPTSKSLSDILGSVSRTIKLGSDNLPPPQPQPAKGDLKQKKTSYNADKIASNELSVMGTFVIPEQEEQLYNRRRTGTKEEMNEINEAVHDVLRYKDDNGHPSDVDDFMARLDYKPKVTKTSSFDKRIKKTINEGEMFRHPENRRIGFEQHSGIDLNRTIIVEEDVHRLNEKTYDSESTYSEQKND